MEKKSIALCIENGTVTCKEREYDVCECPWSEHPKFKGVYLKHLVKGTDTNGMLSSHMVKVDPCAVLEEHIHDSQWELHEVIDGEGVFLLGTMETPYYPGRMAIIPKGVRHKVTAGNSGLVMLAKFFPALI
jgi:quercetin dioxygenase-like cupin family protein